MLEKTKRELKARVGLQMEDVITENKDLKEALEKSEAIRLEQKKMIRKLKERLNEH